MKNRLLLPVILLLLGACSTDQEYPRTVLDFNFDWKFTKGEMPDASNPDFDDSGWQKIRVPHDWSVEEVTVRPETGVGYWPGGIGWYRKTFTMPADAEGKKTWIEFDGIYNNSTVWLNGQKLGHRPYGYIPFSYDLTPHLYYDDRPNTISVRVDRTSYVDCRWYTGSGIYRNVKLVTVNPVHIPQWETVIHTPLVSEEKAHVKIYTTIQNETKEDAEVIVQASIKDPTGKFVAEAEESLTVGAGNTKRFGELIEINAPQLWDTENPNLYIAVVEVVSEGEVIDGNEITFGLRHFRYDPEEGFFLNGKNTLIKGVNIHHDGGLTGAAVPDGVWERRLKILKEGGCNAIRTAHNPPSQEFLDMCDRMGFLVQDEAFDEFDNPKDKLRNFNQEEENDITRGYTEHFGEWGERDIKAMVRRDRNHPSIIMWSIGNEIEWTYPRYGASTGYWGSNKVRPNLSYYWDEPPLSVEAMKKNFYAADSGEHQLATTAHNLSRWVRDEDKTRPVTANLVIPSISHWSGFTDALDIIGYSYRAVIYDYSHELYPDKLILGTENFPRWHEWKSVLERPFIPGIFVWKGIGYMGTRKYPGHGGNSGFLNMAGFKNPEYHHYQSFWTSVPKLYLTTQVVEKSPYTLNPETGVVEEKTKGWWKRQTWGGQNVNEFWNYPSGEDIAIEAYTNCVSVELFLNGESIGTQKLEDQEDRILKWIVPYQDGTLTARGTMPDGTLVEEEIRTAGEPTSIRVTADKEVLKADFYDVVHLVAQLEDDNGVPVKNLERQITFNVEGDCRILGIDNGSGRSSDGLTSNTAKTYRGKCLFIIQSNDKPGEIIITASSEGMEDSEIRVTLK